MDAPSNNQTRGIRRSLLGLGLAALLLASCAGGKGDSGAAGETGTPGTNFVPMTVSVANLAQGSTVETGFMVGTTTDGSSSTVATVEVSLDGHTYSAATGAASWKFQLPAGGVE